MKVIEVQHDFFHAGIDWVDVTKRKEVKVVRVMVDNGNDTVSVYFTADDLRAMLSAIEDAEKFENWTFFGSENLGTGRFLAAKFL